MKKVFIISLILCGIVVTGCSEQNKLSQDELFDKKQECSSYKDKMNIQVSGFSSLGNFFEVDEIFYSPTKNSCLYTVKVKYGKNISETIENQKYAAVIDYLNNTIIESTFSELNGSYSQKSTCNTKYFTDDLETTEDTGKVEVALKNYFNCMKDDFDITLKKLKGE